MGKAIWNNTSKCIVMLDRRDAIIAFPPIDGENEPAIEEELGEAEIDRKSE